MIATSWGGVRWGMKNVHENHGGNRGEHEVTGAAALICVLSMQAATAC